MLDLCAAPGGKATQLAAAGAEVVAVEKHSGRARELEANARRLGAALTVVNADALDLPEAVGTFDRALVDAPCSGLGVLNSRPDLRWRGEPLPELQLGLLRAAAGRVRPGGTITYAVCTINRAENAEVVDALGLPVEDLGATWLSTATRAVRSSSSRSLTCTARPASSSPACGCSRRPTRGRHSVSFTRVGVAPAVAGAAAGGDHLTISALHQIGPTRTVAVEVFSIHDLTFNVCTVSIQALAN